MVLGIKDVLNKAYIGILRLEKEMSEQEINELKNRWYELKEKFITPYYTYIALRQEYPTLEYIAIDKYQEVCF